MNKIFMFIISLSLLTTGCQKGGNYSIKGKIDNPALDGSYVLLQKEEEQQIISLDTALIEKGEFVFKGDITEPEMAFIVISGEIPVETELVLEKGDITIAIDSLGDATVTGTRLNQVWQEYVNDDKKVQALKQIFNDAYKIKEPDSLLEAKYRAFKELFNNTVEKNIEKNTQNIIGLHLLKKTHKYVSYEFLDKVLPQMTKTYKNDLFLQNKVKECQNAKNVEPGKKIPDILLRNTEGKEVHLSGFYGEAQYIIVDFWASWCGPCIKEIPTLQKIYKEYQPKGLEIVSISLDQDEEAWKKAIEQYQLTWPQISDLKGWDSEAVSLYTIQFIPHIVITDRFGTILFKDLRGDDLIQKIEELFAPKQ